MKDINLEEKNYLLIFLLKLHYQITQIDQNYLSTVVLFEHLYIMYMEILIFMLWHIFWWLCDHHLSVKLQGF
jgi:hypothetical protein